MLHITSRKTRLSLYFYVLSLLFMPTIVSAESDTGSIAASQAAEQRAALEKKAADRQAKKAAQAKADEAKKAAESATETPTPTEEKK